MKTSFAIAKASLVASGLTAARTFTLQDGDGAIALLHQVPSNNTIINGNMRIAQRGTSFAAVASGSYTLDRWQYAKVGTMVHTISQSTDVPTLAQAGQLFTNSIQLALTTADTSIAADDALHFSQKIEGFNWAPLAQRGVIVSFWVKSGLTGIYCLSLRNGGADRSCVQEFSISAANTWEYKTVTFPASPSAGTWDYGTGIGVYLTFSLASGSNYHTTAGTWQTGNLAATAAAINGVNTGAGNFLFTGMQLEAGAIASPFAARSFGAELALCQRYYQVIQCGDRMQAAGANHFAQTPAPFMARMRAAPTAAITAGTRNNLGAGFPSIDSITDVGARFTIQSNAAGDAYALNDTVALTAEL